MAYMQNQPMQNMEPGGDYPQQEDPYVRVGQQDMVGPRRPPDNAQTTLCPTGCSGQSILFWFCIFFFAFFVICLSIAAFFAMGRLDFFQENDGAVVNHVYFKNKLQQLP